MGLLRSIISDYEYADKGVTFNNISSGEFSMSSVSSCIVVHANNNFAHVAETTRHLVSAGSEYAST